MFEHIQRSDFVFIAVK